MLKLNEINVNELIDSNDSLFSNRNDIELNIDSSGYYKIKCIEDSIIDSIEYVGFDIEMNYENVLNDIVGIKDDYEYVNIKLEEKNNIEMIYEDDKMNVEIIRRKDDNRIFKLCYDNGDSLCEVYKLVNDVYVDSDEEEVYG
tara:strand:- start:386 stop:811 length:426 start_codon:yes stop_codon:yes gene_type:complete